MQTTKEHARGARRKPKPAAMKVVKAESIEAFMRDDDPTDGKTKWDFWHTAELLVELPDGSKWGPLFPGMDAPPRAGEIYSGLKRPYMVPYLDIYNRHMARRHRSAVMQNYDGDDVEFVVRADRADLTKIFCICCGWLSPATDPEIAAAAEGRDHGATEV